MNIDQLNRKIIRVMQKHDLVVRDSIQCLAGSKLGVSYEFIKRKNVDLIQFKKFLDEHNVKVVIVYSGPLNMSTKTEFEVVLSNQPFEYFVAPSNSSAQLRFLYQQDFIQGIVALPQFLEYAGGFKQLNHLIIDLDIQSKSFSWVDIKVFTAKGCISLDSLSSMIQIFDYAQNEKEMIFDEKELESFCKFKFDKGFNEIEEQIDVLYSFTHQILQGKLVDLEQQLLKFQHLLKKGQLDAILNFSKQVCSTPIVNIQGDWLFIYDSKIDHRKIGPQLPTEIVILQCMGIANFFTQNKTKKMQNESIEQQLMNYPDITDKAMYIIGNKLNYSYKQYYSTNECAIGQFNYQNDLPINSFKDAIEFYLNNQRQKSGEEDSKEKKQTNHRLNIMLKFLKFFELIHEENQSLAAKVIIDNEHNSQQLILFFYLLQSQISHIYYDSFYNYYLQHNMTNSIQGEQLNRIKELYSEGNYISAKKQRQQNYELINLISRVFSLMSINVECQQTKYNGELLQYVEILNRTNNVMKQVYDSLIVNECFEKVQHKDFNSYVKNIKIQFNHLYTPEYGQKVIQFLQKPSLEDKPNQECMMFWDKMVKNVQGCEQKIVEVFNKANEFLYDKYNQI